MAEKTCKHHAIDSKWLHSHPCASTPTLEPNKNHDFGLVLTISQNPHTTSNTTLGGREATSSSTLPVRPAILALKTTPSLNDKGDPKHAVQDPMQRFFSEGPSEQSSVVALTNGKLNISKGCTCAQGVKKSANIRL
ncbi:uncharacterized protein AB675_2642 [Cyphellophora attinorum]|uniref:Uncharacterized protein n=1 Tax=Cyphellophora attinorum TaxID=1664694 RepID=A0A0N1P455_9EURO|nr:uncharacterized protein AB675_2642 [Phialophora attinorum]KPI45073.1 hypothetical protein AB675_2642 [Phialophora attinorum]